jgi:hypothetical protein
MVYGKITDMIRDKIHLFIPEMPDLIEKAKTFDTYVKSQKQKIHRDEIGMIALKVKDEMDALKLEFDFLKRRYSPEYLQHIESTLTNVTVLKKEFDILRSQADGFVTRDEYDRLES